MAEDGTVDYDDDYYEWDYVEDDYPLADELAETQLPSPGHSGTRAEIDEELELDFDTIWEYWLDVEYNDDAYWDEGARVSTSGVKRKRKRATQPTKQDDKRRKVVPDGESARDPIRFRSLAQRVHIGQRSPKPPAKTSSFALLPDWRTRYAKDNGKVAGKSMPAEMREAAEAHDLFTPPKRRAPGMVEAEEDYEAFDDDGDEIGEEVNQELESIDPEVLKKILVQRLKDAGLDGVNDEAFMRTIAKMTSGEEGAEKALTDMLLSLATGGQDAALVNWLGQQGVALEDDGEDERRNHQSSRSNSGVSQTPPRDSAIDPFSDPGSEQHISPSTPPSGKKRAAVDENAASAKRRRAGLIHPTVNGDAVDDADGSIEVADMRKEDPDTVAIAGEGAQVAQKGENKEIAFAMGVSTADPAPTSYRDEDVQDEIKVSSRPARQTQKRKADTEAVDLDQEGGSQPQKLSRSSGPEAESNGTPVGRRTRSARAKRGK